MNDPDQISENLSPREELEVRILALLLGEANEAEKEELESLLASDSQLQAYREQMEKTLGLAGEASHALWNSDATAPAQLSEGRRAALRELWDNSTEVDKDKGNLVRPPEKSFFKDLHPLVPLSLAASLAILLGGVWFPRLLEQKTASKVAFEADLPAVANSSATSEKNTSDPFDNSGSMFDEDEEEAVTDRKYKSEQSLEQGRQGSERNENFDEFRDGTLLSGSVRGNVLTDDVAPRSSPTMNTKSAVKDSEGTAPLEKQAEVPASAPSRPSVSSALAPLGLDLTSPEPEAETPAAGSTSMPISDGLADKVSSGKSTIGKGDLTLRQIQEVVQPVRKQFLDIAEGDHFRMDVEKEKAELEGSPGMGSQPFGNDEDVSSSLLKNREALKNSPVDPSSLDAPVLPAPSHAPVSEPMPISRESPPSPSMLPKPPSAKPMESNSKFVGQNLTEINADTALSGFAQDYAQTSVSRDQFQAGNKVGFRAGLDQAQQGAKLTTETLPEKSPKVQLTQGLSSPSTAPRSGALAGGGVFLNTSSSETSQPEVTLDHGRELDLLKAQSESLLSKKLEDEGERQRSRKLPAESQPHVSQQLHFGDFHNRKSGRPGSDAKSEEAELEEVSDALIVASGELASEADSGKAKSKDSLTKRISRKQKLNANLALEKRELSMRFATSDGIQSNPEDLSQEEQEKLLWYGRTKAKEEAVAGSENAKTAQAPRDSLESFDDAGVLNEAVKVAGIYPPIDSDDAEDDKKILEDHGIEVPVQLPKPKPEVVTEKNRWSTFSLNVSDASFRLCEASLRNGRLPAPHMVRAEEFINAFDYRDPAPAKGAPLAFAWERSRHPFAHNRDLVRFSIQTAAEGRESGQPLNLVLAIDNSGSMERSDRVAILKEALKVLAAKLRAEDTVSVVAFSRTPRLWLDGQKGESARQKLTNFPGLVPQGGTNIESALDLGYSTALKHFISGGNNRLILLTDGAANLGAIVPNSLRNKVESYRKRGVALDCFGIGWDGYNDHLMEALARNGDGRYAFLNSATDVERDFGRKLAGALSVSAADVKVQVVFNPARVKTHRQIGYLRHQLKKDDFRNNAVDAAEIGAAESGNAVYVLQIEEKGTGPLGRVHVRYREPSTNRYKEMSWPLPHRAKVPALAEASTAMRLAACSATFAEWLGRSPFATDVELPKIQELLFGLENGFPSDSPVRSLQQMVGSAYRIVPR